MECAESTPLNPKPKTLIGCIGFVGRVDSRAVGFVGFVEFMGSIWCGDWVSMTWGGKGMLGSGFRAVGFYQTI